MKVTVKKFKVIKECDDPRGRHKRKIAKGQVITTSDPKLFKSLVSKGFVEEVSIKGTNFKSKEEAEKIVNN